MLQTILMMMMYMMIILFFYLSHPLAMGMVLLIQTTLISIYSGLIFKNFWFSYILFLTFMGGLLVLFIYITSLASNEMFSFSTKTTLSMLITFCLSILMMYMFKNLNFFSYFKNKEMMEFNLYMFNNQENLMELINMYKYPTSMITMMLIMYLFLSLIVTVKITKMSYGPLRPMY